MNARRSRGVGLVEVLVVVAIVGIITALAAPSFADFLNRRRVTAVAEEISTGLAYAKSETALRSSKVNVRYMNGSGMSCYTIYYNYLVSTCDCTRAQGSACQGGNSIELKTYQLMDSTGVRFSSATGSGNWGSDGPGNMEFTVPQMLPNPGDLMVNVEGVRSGKLTVKLNAAGRISTCTPDGSMSGVVAC